MFRCFFLRRIKNLVDKIYEKKQIQEIRSEKTLRSFLTNNIHITRIVVFSSRKSPHVILRHAAATFAKEVKFAFVFNSNKNKSMKLRELLHVENTGGSILVVVVSLVFIY